jgi:hypothetical protein
MTKVNASYFNEFREPAVAGPAAQMVPAVTPVFPASLTISGGGAPSWVSDPIISHGFKSVAVSVQTTRAGTLTIQRYLDDTALIPIGAPITATLAANVQNFVSASDSIPYGSFKITIANTDGAQTSVISNFGVLLQAG